MIKTLLLTLGIAAALHGTYPAAGIVTGVVDGGPAFDDIVVVTTAAGHTYIARSDDLQIGDIVAMTMDDNGTPNDVRDDVVTALRYSGFTYQP